MSSCIKMDKSLCKKINSMIGPFSFKHRQQKSFSPTIRGFTLVEMVVSVALFAIVMLVCVGSLLALVGANQKVQALQSVMNNLNVSLDGMVRSTRMGNTFHCGTVGAVGSASPLANQDCTNGDTTFAFEPYGNIATDQPWIYTFDSDGTICGTAHSLCRSQNGAAPVAITAPEVTIDSLMFYVVGSTRGCTVNPCDIIQPKVVIVIKGTAPVANSRAKSSFHIQVTAVQRLLDL